MKIPLGICVKKDRCEKHLSMTGKFDWLPFFSISHKAFTAQRLDK